MKKILFITIFMFIFAGCSIGDPSLRVPVEVLESKRQSVEIIEYKNDLYIIKDGKFVDVAISKKVHTRELVGCVAYILIIEGLAGLIGYYISKNF